jgi:hypothetical protein
MNDQLSSQMKDADSETTIGKFRRKNQINLAGMVSWRR